MPRLSFVLPLLLLAPAARADVKPAPIFAAGMVLQREMPVPVWGTAAAGEEVTVTFGGQKKTATTDRTGKWKVTLDKLEAGGPHKLVIAGKNTVTLDDVLVGEVWLCSGQSNMAWRLSQSENAQKEAESADLPKVRYSGKQGSWQACSPKTAPTFSACAYYFGRDLHKALKVPVGLVNRSVGGTSARRWVSVKAMEQEEALKPYLEAIKGKDGKAKGTPGDLYEAHVRPLEAFALRGVIWYQGESDAGRPDEYAVLFPTLIRSWRKAWGQGDFPFLYVQLAPIGGRNGWEKLREAQGKALSLPKTAMAVIIDSDADIHPKKKQLPGARLALAARAVAHGEKIVHSGPVYESVTFDDGKAVLKFTSVGGGLAFSGDRAKGFTVVDADGKAADAEAKIDGDKVIVWSKQISKPAAVRYGWSSNPGCNLINKEGLPASPFRTDGDRK
jgi:sialate O-acetylesterase